MLYLEDYLEIIENLPQEIRDRFTEMRELDLQVNNEQDKHDEKQRHFFIPRTGDLPEELQQQQYKQLEQEYEKIIEYSMEKCTIAGQLSDLIEKYFRRLEVDLQKFKLELEADNPGITERIERRFTESTNAAAVNHTRGEKRKHHSSMNAGSGKYNSNSSNHNNEDNNKKTKNEDRMNGYNYAKYNKNASNNQNQSSMNYHSFENSNNLNNSGQNWPSTKSSDDKLNNNSGNNFNTKLSLSGSNAIAAIASQAIVQTSQSNTVGRKTASLKASCEAIGSGLTNHFYHQFNTSNSSSRTDDDVGRNDNRNDQYESSQPPQIDRLKRSRIKRNRSSNNNQMNNFDASDANSSDAANTDYNNANEQRYCYCNSISYGEMIFCENKECPYQWFHYECVGIDVAPEGSWFCPTCEKKC